MKYCQNPNPLDDEREMMRELIFTEPAKEMGLTAAELHAWAMRRAEPNEVDNLRAMTAAERSAWLIKGTA